MSSLPRSMAGGLLINAGFGVLYVWSLFLVPLEAGLALDRGMLSLVPALALVGFTIGMFTEARVLAATSPPLLAAIALGLGGAGHILFGLFPSYVTLLIGYSFAFGIGGGLGYLLALGLAAAAPANRRGLFVGLTVGIFAGSGVLLSFLLPPVLAAIGPARTFLAIGVALWILGVVVFLLLRPLGGAGETAAAPPAAAAPVLAPLFLKLAVAFFAVCAVGLMVVSHSTGILVAIGAGTGAWLGPILYNLGYIGGSLTGARLEQAIGGRAALTVINAAMIVALLPLAFAAPVPVALASLAIVGATLGGVASVMPMVVTDHYGAGALGSVYGKLNVSYGLGGLIAPWLAGILYVATGSYALSMWLGIALAVIGIAASLGIGEKARAAR